MLIFHTQRAPRNFFNNQQNPGTVKHVGSRQSKDTLNTWQAVQNDSALCAIGGPMLPTLRGEPKSEQLSHINSQDRVLGHCTDIT